jgi:predicted GH43/DUF377 family glycosyl hydrolase
MPTKIEPGLGRAPAGALSRCVVILAAGAIALGAQVPADWGLGHFVRSGDVNPVIAPSADSVFFCPMRKAPIHWEALHTFNPAAVVRNGRVYVLYRAEDASGEMQIGMHTSRLGLAESGDGLHFTRRPAPVLYPADDDQKQREWEGGCEDPRVTESPDGTYVLTYTQWNRQITDIAIATSKDLVAWTKRGPAFSHASGGKYMRLFHKSAGIVSRISDGRLIAAKVNGKYWMYWGEVEIHLATSNNLIDWLPVEDAKGDPIVLMGKRPGHFDSSLPEVGPPPLLTRDGIVVLYNGKNAAEGGDPNLPAGTYAAGEALFRANDPAKLISRTAGPVFKPELPFEKSGQYAAGTTFTEGLVRFQGKYFLYYGCADSLVAVAVSDGAPVRK